MKHLSIFLLSLLMVACSSNEEDASTGYSPFSASTDRDNIEIATSTFHNYLDELSESSFAQTSLEMEGLIEEKPDIKANDFIGVMLDLGGAMKSTNSIDIYFSVLKRLVANENEKMTSFWKNSLGTWEWDATTNSFKRTKANSEEIIYHFPSASHKDTNNCVARIYDFELNPKSKQIQSMYFEMKLDNKLIVSSNINVEFDSNGDPEHMALVLNPIPFSLEVAYSESDQVAVWLCSASRGANLFFKQQLILKGDFSKVPPSKITNLEVDTYFSDIKMKSMINTANLLARSSDFMIPSENETEYELNYPLYVDALKSNGTFLIQYANGDIIAHAEPFVSYLESTIVTDSTKNATENIPYIDYKLHFNDKRSISASTYFDHNLNSIPIEIYNVLLGLVKKDS